MDRVTRWVRELSPRAFWLLVSGLVALWLALMAIVLVRTGAVHVWAGNPNDVIGPPATIRLGHLQLWLT